eukprot:4718896-Pleurochrysis_carterae.AAC.4
MQIGHDHVSSFRTTSSSSGSDLFRLSGGSCFDTGAGRGRFADRRMLAMAQSVGRLVQRQFTRPGCNPCGRAVQVGAPPRPRPAHQTRPSSTGSYKFRGKTAALSSGNLLIYW